MKSHVFQRVTVRILSFPWVGKDYVRYNSLTWVKTVKPDPVCKKICTKILTNCILEHVLLLKGFGRLVDGSETNSEGWNIQNYFD